MTSLSALKWVTSVLGLVPLVTGVVTMLGIHDPIYRELGLPASSLLDSNLRFFGGVWLGLGLAVLWVAPRLLTHPQLFRAAWLMIFLGGVGRLLSMVLIGLPPAPFIGFTVLEIVGAPVFLLWHRSLLRQQAAGTAPGLAG